MLSYIPYLVLFCFALFFVLFFAFEIDPGIAFYRSVIVFFMMILLTYLYRGIITQVINPQSELEIEPDELEDVGGEDDVNQP
jgi:hypothetical protein